MTPRNHTRNHRIVILGAGYAGMTTAIRTAGRLRKAGSINQAQITLINAEPVFVERVRLHQRAAGQRLKKHDIREMLPRSVDFVQAYVSGIDANSKRVVLHDGRVVEYDTLVYALGSRTNMDLVKGAQQYAVAVEDRDLMDKVAAVGQQRGNIVVVGGGLTGIEISSEIAETYPDVHVSVVTSGALGDNLSKKGRAYLHQAFGQRGIQVIDHARVLEVREGEILTAQGSVPFDLCLWAASMKVSDLARQAGLQVNTSGQILTDKALRSLSHPDVFAVGDAATMTEAPVPTRMSCQLAQPQGAHTADNLARVVLGETVQPFNFRYALLCISLGRSDGLVHVVTPEDVPTERIFTGRVGAWIKEIIVWSTVFAMKMERWFPGSLPIPAYPHKKHNKATEARRPLEERTEGQKT